jgi:hypothetical protein
MRVSKVTPVVKAQPVKRRVKEVKTAYQSDIDPAVIIHSSKTHRTASEAFRDADYATSIWRCENEFDRTMGYLGWTIMWGMLLGGLYLLATGFEKWIAL